jgi:hypothetical protein
MQRNARFDDYTATGATVTLTLKPGATLTHVSGGPTEEGYYRCETVYAYTDGIVYRDTYTDSRDCDGRYSMHTAEQLIDGKWERVNASQRDYSAEAAGY